MSLVSNIDNALIAVASEFKKDRAQIGDITALRTLAKGSLVAAVNEVLDIANAASGGTGGLTEGQVRSIVDQAVLDLKASAPEALDTLNELAAALGNDKDFATNVTALIGTKANDNAVVKLTGAQTVAGVKTFSAAPVVPDGSWTIAKTTGLQAAINAKQDAAAIGNTETDFVATFNAGLV